MSRWQLNFLTGLVGVITLAVTVKAILPNVLLLILVTTNQIRFADQSFGRMVVAGASTGLVSLWDVIGDCRSATTGDWYDVGTCAVSVLSSTVATGLAVHSYQSTDHATKRSLDITELSVAYGGKQILSNTTSPAVNGLLTDLIGPDEHQMQRRNENNLASIVDAYIVKDWALEPTKNSTGHLTFEGSVTNSSLGLLHAFLTHRDDGLISITPINNTVLDHYLSGKTKREGFTGYDLTAGSITVYCNSDPVATWDDAITWASALYPDTHLGEAYLYTKLEQSYGSDCDLLGMATEYKQVGNRDGQFIARSYTNTWTDWESGLNWCFGSYLSNCEGTSNEYINSL